MLRSPANRQTAPSGRQRDWRQASWASLPSRPRAIPRWATMTTSPPSSSATANFHLPSTDVLVVDGSTSKGAKMSERLETLKKARERMIDDRDAHAKVLAAPFDREKAERARGKFTEIQALIDALDRAIRGEDVVSPKN